MASTASPPELARQARRVVAEYIGRGMSVVGQSLLLWSQRQIDLPAARSAAQERRDLHVALTGRLEDWQRVVTDRLGRQMLQPDPASSRAGRPASAPARAAAGAPEELDFSLVDDATIEREISGSRLGSAIADLCSWELVDLRARVAHLEGAGALGEADLLMPASLGRLFADAWRDARLQPEQWRACAAVLHEQIALACLAASQEANRRLVAAGVMPEVRLQARKGEPGAPPTRAMRTPAALAPIPPISLAPAPPAPAPTPAHAEAATPLMTAHADELAHQLSRLMSQHLPTFAAPSRQWQPSPDLATAIQATQQMIRERVDQDLARGSSPVTQTALMEELGTRKQQLKRAAGSQEERATIEVVDLLFQAILAEDRIPASVRVLFARLQMPVLRVAVSEPDFFAAADHPARRLIDRMGACAMGFDTMASTQGDELGREIRRVVQVVEAYPDTGRRVFQTVLNEFEKFVENFMRTQSDAARQGISLAEQVEQRETLAIQYTIELRKMLDAVPVQDGIRDFLFQVWADVLAITSLRNGAHSEQTQAMKRAAADLIWAAGAKVSREERTDVIRRLPQLLKAVREGMASAGLDAARQEAVVRELNNALAAAFTAKSAPISKERLGELTRRLETLDELLPDVGDLQLDEEMMLDLSGQETSDLEVASDPGGATPSPLAVERAQELLLGSWHTLDFRGRTEPVQLAWRGMRRHLAVFVTAGGRCVLFPRRDLALYIERGALRPVEDEPLMARATRNVLARLDSQPSLLAS